MDFNRLLLYIIISLNSFHLAQIAQPLVTKSNKNYNQQTPMKKMDNFKKAFYQSIFRVKTLVKDILKRLPLGKLIIATLVNIKDYTNLRKLLHSTQQSSQIMLYREAFVSSFRKKQLLPHEVSFGILTAHEYLYIAEQIADRLTYHGFACKIIIGETSNFQYDFYYVINPLDFNKLPPSNKLIVYQLKDLHKVTPINNNYKTILQNSLYIADFSIRNVKILQDIGIQRQKIIFLPILTAALSHHENEIQQKKYDIIIIGNISSAYSATIQSIKDKFQVYIISKQHVINKRELIKSAKIAVILDDGSELSSTLCTICECLSHGLEVICEETIDLSDYSILSNSVVKFSKNLFDAVCSTYQELQSKDIIIKESKNSMNNIYSNFMFDRAMLAMNFLPSSYIKKITPPISEKQNIICISLPETYQRRASFLTIKPKNCVVYDGIIKSPGWVGCGLSFQSLAHYALNNYLDYLTVMEDDVLPHTNFEDQYSTIIEYLSLHKGNWDVFCGIMASINSNAKILNVENHKGITFITLDKMLSGVFNIYSKRALQILTQWQPENDDHENGQIDKFLGEQENLKVITTIPFIVQHREDSQSTIWGFKNSYYKQWIERCERTLSAMAEEFCKKNNISL